MNAYFAYTRVSTAKQGEGVSLQEQRAAIDRYAHQFRLQISEWFEEKETAAKRGRPVFSIMLKALKASKARGVLIHKIDRSARNLKDWADLGDLIDAGIEVHFANESLDLNTRGGRLSADIQAVVAADYIRNLREETRKGFYGRLKQGLYPLPAPVGYKDAGKGKRKEIDPVRGPLVAKGFELYGTGKYGLIELVEEMYRRGLRNRAKGKVTLNGMSVILNNPFYIGLMRLKKTGETFEGEHEPLIPKSLFDRVQRLLRGKTVSREQQHEFLFRRLLTCEHCGYSLIGEFQKSRVYYRCHTKACVTKTVREDAVQKAVEDVLQQVSFSDAELAYIGQRLNVLVAGSREHREKELQNRRLQLAEVRTRLERLTDAFLDGAIGRDLFDERKEKLLLEKTDLQEKVSGLEAGNHDALKQLENFLELAKSAYSSYENALPDERREMLAFLTSNRVVDGKNVVLKLSDPFQVIANRHENSNSTPYRGEPRTLDKLLTGLVDFFAKHPKVETRTQA